MGVEEYFIFRKQTKENRNEKSSLGFKNREFASFFRVGVEESSILTNVILARLVSLSYNTFQVKI